MGSPPTAETAKGTAVAADPAEDARSFPIELLPGLLCVGVFIAWSVAGGGYETTSSAPGGLFLLGVLCVVLVTGRDALSELSGLSLVAVGLLAAFVLWNFLSISWAEVQGVAWDGANRTLLYLVAFVIFIALPWRPSSAWIVMGTYSVGLAIAGAIVLSQAITSVEPANSLIVTRFAQPVNYPNGVAALFIGGFWPATFLAGRRETPWFLRGPLLATAAFLAQMALLPQSRGAVIVFPVAILIYLLVVPNRLRALLFLVVIGLASALAAPAILDVFTVAEDGGDVGTALFGARDSMLLSFATLVVAGTLLGLGDRRLKIPERTSRLAGRATAVLLAVVAIAGAAVAVASVDDPLGWPGDRWADFKGGYDSNGFGGSRFSGDLGSNRYDFWRVAIGDEFGDAPLVGNGSDNFAVTYLQHRVSGEEPLYPHSLPIRIVAGTGIIGGLLFAGFAVAALLAVIRNRRRRGPSVGVAGVAAVVLAASAYLAMHSAGDWLWSLPAVTAPVFAWLGIASRPLSLESAGTIAPRKGAPGTAARRAGIAFVLTSLVLSPFLAVSLTLPWLAARNVEIASSSWRSDPDAAFDRLDRAAGLNFLSAEPDLTAGAIASQMGDRARVREFFTRSLEREPTNWYAKLELAAVDALEGNRAKALNELKEAHSLNPGDDLISQEIRRVRSRNPMALGEIDQVLLDRVCAVVGRTGETTFCE